MNEWSRVWRWLKPRLEAVGRTRCEFPWIPHECWGALYPCHSRKRRNMTGDDIYRVAMGCQQIARILDEDMREIGMETEVLTAIERNGGLILDSTLRGAEAKKSMKRFIATGNTYPYREDFISWGWHWDAQQKAWIEDNGSTEGEPCIRFIQNLPGVEVTIESDEKNPDLEELKQWQ